MKQGTFDIINGTPIVFAYVLPKPNRDDFFIYPYDDEFYEQKWNKAIKEYESSRKEWEVENWLTKDIECDNCSIQINSNKAGEYVWKEQQVKFKEITPPTDKERGKCKIVKIIQS